MVDDYASRQLETELRHFRRQPEPFSSARLVAEPLLNEYLGIGDRDQAWTVLQGFVEEHADDRDSDISIFFRTCGWITSGENLDQRLEAAAKDLSVHPRTVLRASDRGAAKLAMMLRLGNHGEQRPFAEVLVQERDGIVRVRPQYNLIKGADYRLPSITINDEPIDVGEPDWSPSPDYDGYYVWQVNVPETQMNQHCDEPGPAWAMRASWLLPVRPSWIFRFSSTDARLFQQTLIRGDSICHFKVFRETDPESWTFVGGAQ